jgi:hypothetical protein
MDVIGKKKDSYFRNNVWWWRPLWAYCATIAPELCSKVTNAGTNDGDGLGAEDSKILSKKLKESIADGTCANYERQYNEWRASLPKENCPLCNATGIRTDKVGVESGMPSQELSIEQVKALGRTQGWCNGCDGHGTRASWDSHYPFSVDNVEEFAEFLEDCEGFEIW